MPEIQTFRERVHGFGQAGTGSIPVSGPANCIAQRLVLSRRVLFGEDSFDYELVGEIANDHCNGLSCQR
jgi:hypothetical protein